MKRYETMNLTFADALHDCKLVADSIVDAHSFQNADAGLVLGHLDRIIEALEKQIPKKLERVFEEGINGEREWFCSTCGTLLYDIDSHNIELGHRSSYCEYCGQRLDWSEE